MRVYLRLLLLIAVLCEWSCDEKQSYDTVDVVEIEQEAIRDFITEFANHRNTKLVLMNVRSDDRSVTFLLEDFYSSCQLDVGDEFGYRVGNEWTNQTAPLFKTSIGKVTVYIQTGLEKILKSRGRYQSILEELDGQITICVETYSASEDSFSINPPRSSIQEPWKLEILNYGLNGGLFTKLITYRSVREAYGNFDFKIDTVRIDTNYRERYY